MNYIGMDIHKKFTVAVAKDAQGNALAEGRFVNSGEAFTPFLTRFKPEETSIVIESSSVWGHIYTLLESLGFKKIKLANPLKVKAIAHAKVKNDKVDAGMLADLLRANLIPESYVPLAETRRLREVTHTRKMIVKQATQMMNRIHAHFTRRGIEMPRRTFCKQVVAFVKEQTKEDPVLEHYAAVLESLRERLAVIDTQMHKIANEKEDARLLMTIPGIGAIRAVSMIAEIDTIRRFPSEKHFSSYAGLTPTTRQSGSVLHVGRVSLQASMHLKNAFAQAALTAAHMKRKNVLQECYHKLAPIKGKQKALVAAARKLSGIAYAMLRNKQEFNYSYSSR